MTDLPWNYPIKRDQYAYFRAVGATDPNKITEILGIEPDRAYSLGEAYQTPRGHTLKRRQSLWRYNSTLESEEPLEAHVRAIIRKMYPKRIELLKLQEEFSCQVVCVSLGGNFEFVTTLDMQRQMTALGLTFWFDAYPDFNPHEEITELRSQVQDAISDAENYS
ncbi:DUF4279 domain-containing protein [Yoonia sp. 2307UL14-13]|uniref:DUF4279 domain-containing protein n=1 Tax=Yoonia sp. 2307UL14-13 TaxID=3126506 RepID=UPI0030B3771C